MFSHIKRPVRLNQILFDHFISVAPCIFNKQGVGGEWREKKIKGFMRFFGAVVNQFSMGMVCCTRTTINYGYFISLSRAL